MDYDTEVTVQVISDEAACLRRVLDLWEFSAIVHQSHQEEGDTSNYSMLWDHREIVMEAAKSGDNQLGWLSGRGAKVCNCVGRPG